MRAPARRTGRSEAPALRQVPDIRYNRSRDHEEKVPIGRPDGLSSQNGVHPENPARPARPRTGQPAAAQGPHRQNPQLPQLAQIPWLVHGFSTRQGGVSKEYGGQQLNLASTAEDTPECVALNRARLLHKLKAQDASGNPWPLVVLNQVHSAVIHRVYGSRARRGALLACASRVTLRCRPLAHGDGLITNAPGVLLAVKVADCLPVIVADRKRKAVGIFHAGWRGTGSAS